MKIHAPIFLMLVAFAPFMALAQAGGCGDPRAQICMPGQSVSILNNGQTTCVACTGNTVGNGCTRNCSLCGPGTAPDSNHSSCVIPPVKGGCGDPRAQVCDPGQYANTNGNETACLPCTGNTVANGCTRSCSSCGPDTRPDSDHRSCVPYPAGTYKDNSNPIPFGGGCQPTSMEGGTLHATCPNYFGVKGDTTLADADQCVADKHDIENIDGHLRCVLSSNKAPNGHGDVFDIVSKTESQDSSSETVRWRIDHPNVSRPTTPYSQITFHQSDKIKVEAGGCVRTSGGADGQRWKQYVDPHVTFQELNPTTPIQPTTIWTVVYAGGLFITDTKNTLPQPLRNEPFDVAIPVQLPDGFTVPGSGSSSYPEQFDLSLIYYDNDFSVNGYYSHDNGTEGQCSDDGPAWVDITVISPKTPIAYSKFVKGKSFDLTWRTDKTGVDDNGLPLNPLWSFQVEHPGQVPNFQASCAPDRVVFPALPTCTSQATSFDENTGALDTFVEQFAYCNTSDTVFDGHINWQRVTYLGALYFRAFSGEWPDDDDVNFGLETDGQNGQTAAFEGPDTGIGLEFKNSDTLANYNAVVWSNLETPPGLISLGGSNPKVFGQGEPAVVTGLMGIDGVHIGYTELHPTFALAVEVAFDQASYGGQDQTWAFFIRNAGNEGSCAHKEHYWPSVLGDSTYAIQLPWPSGAESVQIVNTQNSKMEVSSSDQQYLGMQGVKPWTYLRFKLPSYTATGMDGEITLHYPGATARRPAMVVQRKPSQKVESEKREEGEFGVDWAALSTRIADPAVRQKFLSEVNAVGQMNASSQKQKMTAVTIDSKQTTFTHNENFGAWVGKPVADVAQPDAAKENQVAALKAVLAKYSAELNLSQTSPAK